MLFFPEQILFFKVVHQEVLALGLMTSILLVPIGSIGKWEREREREREQSGKKKEKNPSWIHLTKKFVENENAS